MKKILDKYEDRILDLNAGAAIFIGAIMLFLVIITIASHFYTFRADSRTRIAELEKKLQDVEEAQRNVNSYFSRELSRTRGELWTLEKLTRGGKTDGREENNQPKAGILRPTDQERKREGDRGYIAPAKI